MTRRPLLYVLAAIAGCTDEDYLARAEHISALTSDGAQVYYVRDDELVREDGTVLGNGAARARMMLVDATHAYVVKAGDVYRYPIAGGSKQALFDPDADFTGTPQLAQDAGRVYVKTTRAEADWWGTNVTLTLGIVAKTGGPPLIRDNRVELIVDIAGGDEHVYGVRLRYVESNPVYDLVELGDAAPSRLIATWPNEYVTGVFAGLGAIYVRGHDGLWRVDPTGAAAPQWLGPETPKTIVFDDRAFYIVPTHPREVGCGLLRQEPAGASRCLLSPDFAIDELAVAGGNVYYTRFVDGADELERVPALGE